MATDTTSSRFRQTTRTLIPLTCRHLFIAAYDVESPESFLIDLPEKKAQEVLLEFNNNYELMADSLQIMNKRMVLLNPVRPLHPHLAEILAGA